MPTLDQATRAHCFAEFSRTAPERLQGRAHWLMRGQNFWLEWVEFHNDARPYEMLSAHETMVFALAGTVSVVPAGNDAVGIPPHAVAILAAGPHMLTGDASARCAIFTSQMAHLDGRQVINAASYEPHDARIVPTGHPYRRKANAPLIQVLPIDQIMASKEKPRLKMLQSETLSVNIVEYEGPRKRSELSPHSHATFEQGSLAIEGSFVHHLRSPWGVDADQWRDDEHLQAGSPSLLVVPVEVIHTTEGVGTGRHVLVDLFSPPRADFIEKGWVFNAHDYDAASAKEST